MDSGIIYRFEQQTGVGKTMTAAFLANRFFELTTDNFYDEKKDEYYSLGIVFSTCHLFKTNKNEYFRENDYFYTPIGILPLHLFDIIVNELKLEIPILCIFDDFDNNGKIMNTFFRKSTNFKRKYNMILIFIGHYDKDLQKSVRENSNFRFLVEIRDNKDIVGVMFEFKELYDELGNKFKVEIPHDFEILNVFDDLKNMYDTKERVDLANPYTFERELLRICKGMNKKQLSSILSMFINDKKEFTKKFDDFSEKLGIK